MSWCGVVQHEELPPSERTNPFADFDRMHALLGETQMLTDEKAHLSNTFWYDGVACGAREWAVCVVYVCVCVCVCVCCAHVFCSVLPCSGLRLCQSVAVSASNTLCILRVVCCGAGRRAAAASSGSPTTRPTCGSGRSRAASLPVPLCTVFVVWKCVCITAIHCEPRRDVV
jgi:hypothetical protein